MDDIAASFTVRSWRNESHAAHLSERPIATQTMAHHFVVVLWSSPYERCSYRGNSVVGWQNLRDAGSS